MPTASAPGLSDRMHLTIALIAAAAMGVMLIAPRASPAVLALQALAIGTAGGLAAGWSPLRRLALPALLLLAFCGWSALSTIWAADKAEAINKSALLAVLVLTAAWSCASVAAMRADLLQRAARASLITAAAALVYLCLEEVTEHALKRLVFKTLPFTQPFGKQLAETDGDLQVAGYITNRNMAALVLTLWPLLLLARLHLDRALRAPAIALAVALAVMAITLSKHETSLIAVGLGGAILGVSWLWPRIGLGLLAAGWITATLLVVPIATWAAHGAKLHNASWLPNSARHRIVLWAYTAEQVWQRPLAGVGAASTKAVDARRGPRVDNLPGTIYQWRSGPHPHNVYLQTWYELGAIGAGLLCAAGLAMIAMLARLPATAVPFGAAVMTAAAVTAAFSWGMWQAWFLAMFAAASVLMALAAGLARAVRDRTG